MMLQPVVLVIKKEAASGIVEDLLDVLTENNILIKIVSDNDFDFIMHKKGS